jgi:hypothetical protein
LTPIKETSASLEEVTDDPSRHNNDTKDRELKQLVTDKQREQNMKFNTGRWTDEEHEFFLAGLRFYEKDWELIQKHVKTRGIANIRAHA